MNYTILADPIRGWQLNNKGIKISLRRKPKSGQGRIKKYRKMLKTHGINFTEVFIPAGVTKYPKGLQNLAGALNCYNKDQELYVFLTV